MDSTAADDLLRGLTAAHAAATAQAATAPLGLRGVEITSGDRAYLCAYDGPVFLCLDVGLAPETSARRVEQVASASLVWEQLEALVDGDRLRELAAAGARVLAITTDPTEMGESIEAVADHALELATWRDQPERALASLPQIDVSCARHERVFRAYERFVAATEGLVAEQDALSPELVGALRGFEEAAGRAGAAERLAPRLGPIIEACHAAAQEIAAAHLTPLR
jgi:hypothetical protein